MDGREEHQAAIEKYIEEKIKGYPRCVLDFYNTLTNEYRSHTTKKVYINHVIRFFNYYIESLGKKTIEDITDDDIRKIDTYHINSYLGSIHQNKKKKVKCEIKKTHMATTISILNTFFNFMSLHEYLKENPMGDKIKRPKLPQELDVIALDETEVTMVTQNIINGTGTTQAKKRQQEWSNRDLLLFLIPIYTGLRVTALTEINVSDINFEEQFFLATDKGDKTSQFYFDKRLGALLEKWIKERQVLLGNQQCDALFISNMGRRMHTNSVRKAVKKYTANLDKKITPHKLRATCATLLYEATKDIYLVADTLRHSNIETTKRYTKIAKQRQKTVPNILAEKIHFS